MKTEGGEGRNEHTVDEDMMQERKGGAKEKERKKERKWMDEKSRRKGRGHE